MIGGCQANTERCKIRLNRLQPGVTRSARPMITVFQTQLQTLRKRELARALKQHDAAEAEVVIQSKNKASCGGVGGRRVDTPRQHASIIDL